MKQIQSFVVILGMKLFRHIALLIAAFHLVFATSGVPLSYMFCGEDFCSLSLAMVSTSHQSQSCPASDECPVNTEKSCCADDSTNDSTSDEMQCHTELHVVKLSVDAVNASVVHVPSTVAPVIAIVSIGDAPAQSEHPHALYAFSLDKPPHPHSDRTIFFRSLLI
ncbi:MAG: hypothetical protein EAZ92_17025 [Candidatus Kapaibacterium sp.]|nr:MAG: hypothetical protein EAZ92_17025 [Candidatus Kapabacteria bacterium]